MQQICLFVMLVLVAECQLLSAQQHMALMTIFDDLGRPLSSTLNDLLTFFIILFFRSGCSSSDCPRFSASMPCPNLFIAVVLCAGSNVMSLTLVRPARPPRNQAVRVPTVIGLLTALTSLTLNSQNLSYVPTQVGLLTALVSLSMNSNKLSSLPPSISRLTRLLDLHLHDNELTTCASEIGQLIRLTALTLSTNRLTSLPPDLSKLVALQEL